MRTRIWIHVPAVGVFALIIAGGVSASVIASYEAGVPAEFGQAGADDPVNQGWAHNGSTGGWADGYDSGDGGWRTLDATGSTYAYYQSDLSAGDLAAISGGWTLTTVASMDSDAITETGSVSDDYYLPPNHGRQNNVSIWVENTAGDYRYIVKFRADENANLIAFDGTNSFQLTSDGTGYDVFRSLEIVYDGSDAMLYYGGQQCTLATSGTAGADRVIFGAVSSGGQGSVVWNSFTLVPEPASLTLLALAALAWMRRR